MSEEKFEIKINVPMIKELVSDKIYRSDASAFREQYVNALSHGCISYHEEYGYTDDVYVHVIFDYGHRKVTIIDNGQGMSKSVFSDNFMSFGFSTVDKKTNNTRSGMFGLGAISFFRIASACIVESWNRKDDEKFTFMTRNTDESEFVTNRTLEQPGTKTEIFLKEHVNIESLVNMVTSIASNYPVKTVLETVNSEGQQSVASYQQNDQDRYTTFERIEYFEDYVKERTNGKYTTVVDDDEMELYLSTTGRSYTNTYLCRVPIEMTHNTGFTAFLNIKKEKIPGFDSFGKPKLQEVPKPDRDSVHERAFDYFTEKIDKLINDMIHAIDIKTFEEYKTSSERWIISGYSVDDKLNPLTHEFIQKLRHRVKYRTADGIQKKVDSLLNILSKTDNIFYHSSLHKGTYDSINNHLKDEQVIFVNDTHGLPLTDAKQYKKDNSLKAPAVSSNNKNIVGSLVRDGGWSTTRIKTQDEAKLLWPGGVYYADGCLAQHDFHYTSHSSIMNDSPYIKSINRNKVGVVVAKSGEKKFPSLKYLLSEISKASKNNKILDKHCKPILMNADMESVKTNVNYRTVFLPTQWSNFEFIKYMKNNYIFVPSKFIYFLNMVNNTGNPYNNDSVLFTIILKHIPNWSKINPELLASVLNIFTSIFRSGYHSEITPFQTSVINMILDIKINNKKITEEIFDEKIQSLRKEYNEPSYTSNIYYDKVFPQEHLKEIAVNKGFNETVASKDGYNMYGFTTEYNGRIPIKINGKLYSKISNPSSINVEIILDKDGTPILIDTNENNKTEIVEHKGKPHFKRLITRYMD